MILLDFFSKKKYFFEIKSLSTNLYWIKIAIFEKKIIFRCSYKIIPISIKKLGEMENLKKKNFPYKFVNKENLYYNGPVPDEKFWNNSKEKEEFLQNFNKPTFDLKKEAIEYCNNDVLILKNCLNKIIEVMNLIDKNLIKYHFSTASISHFLFYNKFNITGIKQKIQIEVDNYARLAFKGGRCEVFGNSNKGEIIKYYDFPGMYAICMKEKFHNGKHKFTSKADFREIGFHTATIKTYDNKIPLLPIHTTNGKLIFPNGEFTDTFWFEELLLFEKMNLGIIQKVHHSLVFEKFEYTFNNFINEMENIKKKSGYFKIFGKLMINSLYGSMALKTEETLNYVTFSDSEFSYLIKNLSISKFYKLNNVYIILIEKDYKYKKIFKNIKSESTSLRNVTYASAITSKARILLFKFMQEIIMDKGRILYCDTDSVFAAYDETRIEKQIFEKKWIEFYEDAVFACPKTYALKKKNEEFIKIKGITLKEINFLEFKKKFYNEELVTFDFQKINSKKDFVLLSKIIKKSIDFGKYDKRIFIKNKKETQAISVKQ